MKNDFNNIEIKKIESISVRGNAWNENCVIKKKQVIEIIDGSTIVHKVYDKVLQKNSFPSVKKLH